MAGFHCNGKYLIEKFDFNFSNGMLYNITLYYMAVSHKDWELPNSRIWLAEIDIDRGLDFSI